MIFVTTSFLITLLLQQSAQPPQYTAAGIAAVASITVALVSASISIFTLFMSRRNQSALQREQALLTQANQKELAMLQSKLTLQTQVEIEKAKSELVEKTQERLEFYKAELAAENQQEIEFLRSRLGEEGKDRDARRDYEYDARKRLYTEVEPVRFHLYEALEEAHYRVKSLARTTRAGNLDGGRDSWLSGPGYYLVSTIYKLLSPVVHFRLLQRRMTFIDFSLDRGIASQYMMLKLYVRSFTDDFLVASLSPSLRYEPNSPQPEAFARKEPAVFSRQGLVLGELECIADIMTAKEDEKARALEFGEFERLFAEEELDDNLQELVNLFTFFSPTRKPVLARLLIIQAYFAQLILSTYTNGDSSQLLAKLDELLADRNLQSSLSWTEGAADFAFVRSYWQPRIEQLETAAFAPTVAR